MIQKRTKYETHKRYKTLKIREIRDNPRFRQTQCYTLDKFIFPTESRHRKHFGSQIACRVTDTNIKYAMLHWCNILRLELTQSGHLKYIDISHTIKI